MRRKPRGSRWSRKRRRNSSTGRVIRRFLLPCAESLQRKVTSRLVAQRACGWRSRRGGCSCRDSVEHNPAHQIAVWRTRPSSHGTAAEARMRRLGVETAGQVVPWNWSLPWRNAVFNPATKFPRKTQRSTLVGRKKEGCEAIQRDRSGASPPAASSVNMRMMLRTLIPGVEHAETDLCTKMPGITSDLK